jgi:REP element-mobilizing transposase RayT
MKFNPQIHHRRSIRLKGHDYSQEGLYYITICVQNRECLFGEISNGKMILNPANGKLWQRNYWEHIIRNNKSHQRIVNYIVNNPVNWEKDKFYL